MNCWQEIWRKRRLPEGETPNLPHLLTLDGFDGFGAIPAPAWEAYGQRMAQRLGVRPSDSLYEVGCGAGAFLYPFYKKGHLVGGIDYAENLVQVARQVMPLGDFHPGEAIALPAVPTVDFVFAHSVFFYFPDFAYAQDVLQRMLAKARKGVAVLDVPDVGCRSAAEAARQGVLGAERYAERYRGLEHLYFPQEWFVEALTSADVTVCTEAQQISGYFHTPYRFNVYITYSTYSVTGD